MSSSFLIYYTVEEMILTEFTSVVSIIEELKEEIVSKNITIFKLNSFITQNFISIFFYKVFRDVLSECFSTIFALK